MASHEEFSTSVEESLGLGDWEEEEEEEDKEDEED